MFATKRPMILLKGVILFTRNTSNQLRNQSSWFVPQHEVASLEDVHILQRFVQSAGELFVLTGAGISTESGIPDYRSANVGLYSRNGYRPMVYAQFLAKHSARQRYWARSFLSWPHIFQVEPNAGHLALAQWQKRGRIAHLVTQNVDRLHHKAGTEGVMELHGNLYTVRCIQCQHRIPRVLFQTILADINKQLFQQPTVIELFNKVSNYYQLARPDGDIDVNTEHFVSNFEYPDCPACNGILKPDIIFFGDNVKRQLVDEIYQLVNKCDSLLVLGSSLQVFSSFRFVLNAHQLHKSILIVNIGPSRADNLSGITRLNVKLGEILPRIQV